MTVGLRRERSVGLHEQADWMRLSKKNLNRFIFDDFFGGGNYKRPVCRQTGLDGWWRIRDSNPRLPRCERGALPAELIPLKNCPFNYVVSFRFPLLKIFSVVNLIECIRNCDQIGVMRLCMISYHPSPEP